jgi:hypothetical protein
LLYGRLLLWESPEARHAPAQGIIEWPRLAQPEFSARCAYTLNLTDQHESWLELKYYACQEPVTCRIALIRVPPFGGRHGGFRWFGLCPGAQYGQRVWKVFCPPDVPCFRCAICHDLTYRSRQTAHWDDAATYRPPPGRLGCRCRCGKRMYGAMLEQHLRCRWTDYDFAL